MHRVIKKLIHLYSFLILFLELLSKLFKRVHPKLHLLVEGQKRVFDVLNIVFSKKKQTLWVHAASLGEYELCLPVLELFKRNYPDYRILLTFFSPSGYEARKKNSITNIVTYLPFDTPSNAKRFVAIVRPKIVFMIKNEFWPNYLEELFKAEALIFCISGRFRYNQFIFKSYGKFIAEKLKNFTHIFLVNEASSKVLNSFGYENHSISGDTNIDRTLQLIKQSNNLDFLENFLKDCLCVVAGSTHRKDEKLILPIVNQKSNKGVKYVIVPHEIYKSNIKYLRKKIALKTILYSEISPKEDLSQYDVMIIDCIGLLTKIYSYADIAYVGGGIKKWDLHNVLEPAIHGIPIIIGSNYQKFYEAENLVKIQGAWTVKSTNDFKQLIEKWINNKNLRHTIGQRNLNYIQSNEGASEKVLNKIQTYLKIAPHTSSQTHI